MPSEPRSVALYKHLGALQLWGIAVGLVISGEYFGWSYGWAQAGTLGFLVIAIVMHIVSMASLFRLREPLLAMGLAVVALGAMIYYNIAIFGAFLVLSARFFVLARTKSDSGRGLRSRLLLENLRTQPFPP